MKDSVTYDEDCVIFEEEITERKIYEYRKLSQEEIDFEIKDLIEDSKQYSSCSIDDIMIQIKCYRMSANIKNHQCVNSIFKYHISKILKKHKTVDKINIKLIKFLNEWGDGILKILPKTDSVEYSIIDTIKEVISGFTSDALISIIILKLKEYNIIGDNGVNNWMKKK